MPPAESNPRPRGYRKLDEALGLAALACAASGCLQCAWKKSAADSASVLGLPSIWPDIMSVMTVSCIAPRKASSPPQSLSASGRERKAATIFDAPSESDLSAGACGIGAAAAAQAVANTSERTAQAQPQAEVNCMIVDPSGAPAATGKNNEMNRRRVPGSSSPNIGVRTSDTAPATYGEPGISRQRAAEFREVRDAGS